MPTMATFSVDERVNSSRRLTERVLAGFTPPRRRRGRGVHRPVDRRATGSRRTRNRQGSAALLVSGSGPAPALCISTCAAAPQETNNPEGRAPDEIWFSLAPGGAPVVEVAHDALHADLGRRHARSCGQLAGPFVLSRWTEPEEIAGPPRQRPRLQRRRPEVRFEFVRGSVELVEVRAAPRRQQHGAEAVSGTPAEHGPTDDEDRARVWVEQSEDGIVGVVRRERCREFGDQRDRARGMLCRLERPPTEADLAASQRVRRRSDPACRPPRFRTSDRREGGRRRPERALPPLVRGWGWVHLRQPSRHPHSVRPIGPEPASDSARSIATGDVALLVDSSMSSATTPSIGPSLK